MRPVVFLLFCLMGTGLLGCLSTGIHETGRVLEKDEADIVTGLSLRYDAIRKENPDSTSPLIQDTLPVETRVGLDGVLLVRAGLGGGWEREAGIKSSILLTFLTFGHGHAPGLILGIRRQFVDGEKLAAAAGFRWSGDFVIAAGNRLHTLAFLTDAQFRVTTSLDVSEKASIYLTPNISYRVARLSDRGPDQNDLWETTLDGAYLGGLHLGLMITEYETSYGIEYRTKYGFEIGVDLMPEQSGVSRTYLLPRIGLTFVY